MKTILEAKWKQLRGQVKERWGKFTDNDLDQITGKTEQLVGLLQQRYGYAMEKAEAEFSEFLRELENSEKSQS